MHPSSWRRAIARQIILPLAPHEVLALVFLVGLPQIFKLSWAAILLVLPDIGAVALASGILALVWSILRTARAFRALRRPGRLHPARTAINA